MHTLQLPTIQLSSSSVESRAAVTVKDTGWAGAKRGGEGRGGEGRSGEGRGGKERRGEERGGEGRGGEGSEPSSPREGAAHPSPSIDRTPHNAVSSSASACC